MAKKKPIQKPKKSKSHPWRLCPGGEHWVEAHLSVAAGIRWLHRKRETASAKLKRQATWLEAAADYKSYLEEWQKNPNHRQMNRLIKYYERLNQ